MTDDGGPAFPAQWHDINSVGEMALRESYLGMSLRDWFAGQALQGILASECDGNGLCSAERPFKEANAKQAYQWADAMLAERSQRYESD